MQGDIGGAAPGAGVDGCRMAVTPALALGPSPSPNPDQESAARLQEEMRRLLAEQRAAFDLELVAGRDAIVELAELKRRLAAA